ncbi:MAG: hypothetical protein LWW86_03480 [Micrococcales bacterium]|nr:hypothetical protein [Micrococcales bacterium]
MTRNATSRVITVALLIGALALLWFATRSVVVDGNLYCGHVGAVALRGPADSGGELGRPVDTATVEACTQAARSVMTKGLLVAGAAAAIALAALRRLTTARPATARA